MIGLTSIKDEEEKRTSFSHNGTTNVELSHTYISKAYPRKLSSKVQTLHKKTDELLSKPKHKSFICFEILFVIRF